MEDTVHSESWGQRNRKWLLLAALVVITVGTLLSMLSGSADFARAYTDEALFYEAVAKAQNNNRVKELIGTLEPVGNMTIAEGNVKYTEDGNGITATITVKGNKGRGKLDFDATKTNGKWTFGSLQARTKEPKEVITIISPD